MKTLCSKVA